MIIKEIKETESVKEIINTLYECDTHYEYDKAREEFQMNLANTRKD